MVALFGCVWAVVTTAACVLAVATRRSVLAWMKARRWRKSGDVAVEIVRPGLRKAAVYAALVVLALPTGVMAGGSALPGPVAGGGSLPLTGGTMSGSLIFADAVVTEISSTTNGDINITPAGSGLVVLGKGLSMSGPVTDITTAGTEDLTIDSGGKTVLADKVQITGATSDGDGALRVRPSDSKLQIAICDPNSTATPEVCGTMQQYNTSTTSSTTLFGTNMYAAPGGGSANKFNTNFGQGFFSTTASTSAATTDLLIAHPGGSNNYVLRCVSSGSTTGTCTVGGGHAYNLSALAYSTNGNCADGAGAAACSSHAAGAFVIDDGTTATVVSTTAVTANSEIFLQFDSSLGSRLGVTCNTTFVNMYPTARTAGTSFTATASADPAGANPVCVSYHIIN